MSDLSIDDRPALRYAGLMGHPMVVVADTSIGRSVVAELNTLEQGKGIAAERADKNPRLYFRIQSGKRKGKWTAVKL